MHLLPVLHFPPNCLHQDCQETTINPLVPHTGVHHQTTLSRQCPLHPSNNSTISLHTRSLDTSTQTTVPQTNHPGLTYPMSVTSHHPSMALSGQIKRVQVILKGLSINTAPPLPLRQEDLSPVHRLPLSATSWHLPTILNLWAIK